MREIGVRELKRSLSETLRAVVRCQHVRVTLRGRAVADIVPAGASASDDEIRRLIGEGRVAAPARARPAPRPHLVKGGRSASSLVLSERDEER
jgi:prevent-host-death family protein